MLHYDDRVRALVFVLIWISLAVIAGYIAKWGW